MDQLENGHSTSVGYGGTVFVPKASLGCAPQNGIPPTAESNCVGSSRRRNHSRRRQLEWRLSHGCRRCQHQFPQPVLRNSEWFRNQLTHRRQEHAVALRAEQLHQQPRPLAPIRLRLSANLRPNRLPAPWVLRVCTTRRKSGFSSRIPLAICTPERGTGPTRCQRLRVPYRRSYGLRTDLGHDRIFRLGHSRRATTDGSILTLMAERKTGPPRDFR